MPKKFILVDQSIAGIAGHHYEYAVHVLRAAEKLGYEPHLVSNVAFERSPEQPPWKTHHVYQQGFWAAEGAPKLNLVALAIEILARIRFRWMFAYQFSLPGLLWTYRDNLTEFIGVQTLRRGNLFELAPLVLLASLLKTLRFMVMLLLLPVALIVFGYRAVKGLLKLGRFPSSYLHHLTADARDAGRFFQKTFSQRNVWMKRLQRRSHGKAFRRDTDKLLRIVQPVEGDIVFIPTLSVTELVGLAELIETTAEARRPTWHLLFRRNIFLGREVDYQHQQAYVSEFQQSLRLSAGKLRGANVRFYTDTEELTAQYDRLNVLPFQTVPIPHTHIPETRGTPKGALRILYIGDARGEKGYHLLPGIIENLWERYVETGRVTFHLQSNFNIPDGEPKAVIAREQLEHLARKKPGAIELFKEPLTSEQYRELLLSGDINLLLYDVNNYYARSSGILVESLSAGMPVIVPAGTWLSRQFQDRVYEWRNTLPERMIVSKARRMEVLKWRVEGRGEYNPLVHGELTAAHKDPTITWIRVPSKATLVLIRLRFSGGTKEAILQADQYDANRGAITTGPARLVESGTGGRAVELIALPPGAARMRLAINSNRPGLTVQFRELEAIFLEPRQNFDTPPLSAVGCVYDTESEISGLLEETVDHYGHYVETARDFARSWGAYHNAEQLVRALEGQPSPMASEAAV